MACYLVQALRVTDSDLTLSTTGAELSDLGVLGRRRKRRKRETLSLCGAASRGRTWRVDVGERKLGANCARS
eukprot:645871-Hanusia_phi.AAC.1